MVFIWLTRFSKKRITLVGLFLFLRLQSYRTHFTTTKKQSTHAARSFCPSYFHCFKNAHFQKSGAWYKSKSEEVRNFRYVQIHHVILVHHFTNSTVVFVSIHIHLLPSYRIFLKNFQTVVRHSFWSWIASEIDIGLTQGILCQWSDRKIFWQ